jgi:hypothetical protein
MRYKRAMTIQAIANAINTNRLVVVCGAGTTAFTAPSSPYGSWRKLLEHGIQTVVDTRVDEQEWAEVNHRQIEIARHPSDFASVAQNIATRLGRRDFITWLHGTVGSLADPERPELIEAIQSLGVPIATTNYDNLIERVTNTDFITWKSPDNMQRALLGTMSGVMHLHGSYLDPDSVIFGSESYGAIVGNSSAQTIQLLMAGGRSMLFIGASGTLEDPNLGRLMARIEQDIPDSGNYHYLLCKKSERDFLVQRYETSTIVVVPFESDDYDALPTFINKIAETAGRTPSQIIQHNYHRSAHAALMERLQSESIVVIDNPESITDINELVVPPVLLSAPHEKIFSNIDEYESGKKHIRTDPAEAARETSIVLVVGEEISGVTTALEWLILTRTADDPGTIPVLVDYGDLQTGVRGLDRLVRRSLAESCGIPPQEGLKGIVLGVDEITPVLKNRTFERFITDLQSDWVEGCFLSCDIGAEAELISALEEHGLTPTVRYMGHMTTKDVSALVRLAVSDDRADTMLEKVQQTLRVEGLPKTAWNIALLLDVFIKTSLTIQSVTPITLLDQFVSSLLGREDYEDSRVSIDARDREAVLAALAALFANNRSGVISEEDVIQFFADLFVEYGWNESPTAMLESLKKRHILTTRRTDPKNIVRFAQSSYLYLFAAKQAKDDPNFKAHLLEDPLFFSKIITHYTSLVRNDQPVLEKMLSLVNREECRDERSASIFGSAPVGSADHPLGLDSVIAAVTSAETQDSEEVETTEESHQLPDQLEPDDDMDYFMENAVTRQNEPFPSKSVHEAPHLRKALTALSLVSNVLRDSELVKNMPLKVETLKRTLHLWADLVYLFEKDDGFSDFTKVLAENFIEGDERPEKEVLRSIEKLRFQFPLFFCTTAMFTSLSSRKLEVAIAQCFEDLIEESPKAAIMAALLSWSTESDDWPTHFARTAEQFSETPAVFDVMFVLARFYYVHEKMSSKQRAEAERFFRIVLEKGGHNVGNFLKYLRADRVRIAASAKAVTN